MREWELSYRLGMRPWIAVAYSAPVAAATAVFLIYPIGQGSFSDGMPLGKVFAPFSRKAKRETRLKGENPRIITCASGRMGKQKNPNKEPDDENVEDNSLLTPTNSAKGVQTLELATAFNAVSLLNQPAVYAIRNKYNNIHYIGESQNLKNRIPKHKAQLSHGTTNQRFLADFNKYGSQGFELIIVKCGKPMDSFQDRLNLQAKLQSLLLQRGLCYNTGLAETLTPRPVGEFPTTPGVYCIRCKNNNACYFGETQQRTGLSGRLRKWRSNLRAGQAMNQKLQADWNHYGEDAFEFIVIESGGDWLDQEKRLTREMELIDHHYNDGFVVYNFYEHRNAPRCHLAARETIIRNQTPEYRQYISQLNTGRENENRLAVVAEGHTYLSYAEAEQCLGITRRSIRQRVLTGLYSLATEEQINVEKERRTRVGNSPIHATLQVVRARSGKGKVVIVNGVRYSSISEAARAYNISTQAMLKRINNNRPGHFYADDEG